MANGDVNKKWYQKPIGFSVLAVVGLLFFPFAIGGALAYAAYKYTRNPKLRTALITSILIPTLFVGSAWAGGLKEVFTSPPPEETIQQAGSETPVLSEEEKEDSELAGQVVGEQAKEDTFLVTRVIDGDTIEIEGGQKVRYIGIDTPKTVHPSKPVGCFGKEASTKNRGLVEGKTVRLEKDVSETDKYGRLLRYVWVGDTFVNDYLVRQGYAYAVSYLPDVKYQDQFREAEREARENSRGLWVADACQGSASNGSTTTFSDKDCPDFATQEEAQAFFISQGGPERDPHRLDGDHDGIACESLPSSSTPEPGLEPGPTSEPQTPDNGGTYTCNCSKTCKQMSSCEEAYYQLNECGCSKRDGDKDGVPCENICQ